MGWEWISSCSFCPASLAGVCRSCRAANTAVLPSVLSLRFIQGSQWFCATLCCAGTPDGLWDHVATRSTGVKAAQSAPVARALIRHKQQAALKWVCFTLPGNFLLHRGLYITILLFFLCFSLTILVLRLVFLAILETSLN